MPNYDYECRRCGETIERNVLMAERDKQKCECSGELRRLITFYGRVWAPTAGGTR